MIHVTYYLEVVSSWCFWAEPAWAELKARYSDRVKFDWKIALMPPEAYPASQAQCDWFYRRSGCIMRAPFMLSSGWFDANTREYPAPNYMALAARSFGFEDDRVRLALATAAVREGRKVGHFEVSAEVAAQVSGLTVDILLARAQSAEVAETAQRTTAEFHALQVTQRPTFLIESGIGDRAVFSGTVKPEPLVAAIEAQLADEAAYGSWKAHFGDPPAG
jgi:predicted DsbA family dithiol-disulfide isomerase